VHLRVGALWDKLPQRNKKSITSKKEQLHTYHQVTVLGEELVLVGIEHDEIVAPLDRSVQVREDAALI